MDGNISATEIDGNWITMRSSAEDLFFLVSHSHSADILQLCQYREYKDTLYNIHSAPAQFYRWSPCSWPQRLPKYSLPSYLLSSSPSCPRAPFPTSYVMNPLLR